MGIGLNLEYALGNLFRTLTTSNAYMSAFSLFLGAHLEIPMHNLGQSGVTFFNFARYSEEPNGFPYKNSGIT